MDAFGKSAFVFPRTGLGRWEAIRKQTYARFERLLSGTPRFPKKRTIGIIDKLLWEFLLTTQTRRRAVSPYFPLSRHSPIVFAAA